MERRGGLGRDRGGGIDLACGGLLGQGFYGSWRQICRQYGSDTLGRGLQVGMVALGGFSVWDQFETLTERRVLNNLEEGRSKGERSG